MRFGKFVVISVACYAFSSQPVGAQSTQNPSWVFGSLQIEDTSGVDPLPLYIPSGFTKISSTGPTLVPVYDGQGALVEADLLAKYEIPSSVIYASTSRSATIRQTCQYSMDDIPPKTIRVDETFSWSKMPVAYPGYAGVSFGSFFPQGDSGVISSTSEFNPAFSVHYVSSYGRHFSSTFILEGKVSATAAAYGSGSGSTNPYAKGVRGWSSHETSHTSNGSGM
jgi:hypothetical protein